MSRQRFTQIGRINNAERSNVRFSCRLSQFSTRSKESKQVHVLLDPDGYIVTTPMFVAGLANFHWLRNIRGRIMIFTPGSRRIAGWVIVPCFIAACLICATIHTGRLVHAGQGVTAPVSIHQAGSSARWLPLRNHSRGEGSRSTSGERLSPGYRERRKRCDRIKMAARGRPRLLPDPAAASCRSGYSEPFIRFRGPRSRDQLQP